MEWEIRGGAVHAFGAPVLFENCIIWNNSSLVSDFCLLGDPIVSGDNVLMASCLYQNYTLTGDYIPSYFYSWDNIINADPLFAGGPQGNFYLSQIKAGQVQTSPCVNTGGGSASGWGLDDMTTGTDNFPDSGAVDMGYHYPVLESPSIVLQSPNGGETLIARKDHMITWSSSAPIRSVKIEYSVDGGNH